VSLLCVLSTSVLADSAKSLFDDGKVHQACKLWLKKAETGDAHSQNELGACFATGVPQKSLKKARYWYRAAADQGIMLAQFNLAVMLENGQGGPKDITKAIFWYKAAAKQGDAPAMFNLGNLYWHQYSDRQKARNWWRKAAKKGMPEAQHNLDLTN
jgi:hypothetical protein